MTDNELIINETIDGQNASGAPATTAAAPKSPVAVKAVNKPDKYIWGIYIFLLVVSIIEVYSASSTEIKTDNVFSPLFGHIRFLIAGFLCVYGLQKLHYKFFRKIAVGSALVSLGLVIYASRFGLRLNDAMRAIPIGSFTLQPAEIMKLALVMMLARIMAKNQEAGGVTTQGVIFSAIAVGVMGISVFQNGLTNMALMMVVSISMFVIGGTQWKKIGMVIACYVILGTAGYLFKNEQSSNAFAEAQAEQRTEMESGYAGYDFTINREGAVDRSQMRKGRITSWLQGVHPGDPVTDDNYQVKHAHYAMAHGKLTGMMPGNSRESARLPLAFSDYIYSIIVEDWGLAGGLLLLLVYMLLVVRAGVVASKCSRAFPALLIMGCAVMITSQALVHMSIVTGVAPVSGQPLPLISKGGTSILIMSIAFGMMLSVSRFAVRNGDKKAINAELSGLPDELKAENPLKLT